MKKILFICLGNICRSPMAAGIFNKEAESQKINIKADSAGFESFHIGDPADKRALETCARHQIDISDHRARLFKVSDFDEYDAILAMDHKNFKDAAYFARNKADQDKLHYVMDLITPGKRDSVPDPYLAEEEECDKVFHLLRKASHKFIETENGK